MAGFVGVGGAAGSTSSDLIGVEAMLAFLVEEDGLVVVAVAGVVVVLAEEEKASFGLRTTRKEAMMHLASGANSRMLYFGKR